jgi:hypothetical protein
MLLDKDIEKRDRQKILSKKLKRHRSKLVEILSGLPTKTGVYYIHNEMET